MNVFAGNGDGEIEKSTYGASWTQTRGASDGTAATYTGEDGPSLTACYSLSAPWFIIVRSFFPFDTSVVEGVITAATLHVWCTFKNDILLDGHGKIYLVKTSQASPSQLVKADFDQVGEILGSDTVIACADLVENAYNAFPLNAVGLAWINQSGWTLLGLREGHDLENVAPVATGLSISRWAYSEDADPNHRPYLEITTGPTAKPYPTSMLRKKRVSGYHCFMNAYIKAKVGGFDPLKLPDGTVF